MNNSSSDELSKIHDLQKTDPSAKQARRNVAVLFVELQCDELDHVSSLISKAIDLIHIQKGTVFNVVSSVVIATFDFGIDHPPDPEGRCEIAAESILRVIGNKAKTLYGTCQGIYGDFGSPTRIQFGPLIPRLSGLIQDLHYMDFGSIQKLSK